MNKTLKNKHVWMNALLLLLLLTMAQPGATAQDQQDQDDPPARVARLGYMEGSVSFEPAGEQDWVEAVPNRPMTTGDQLWTDRDSRAEVQLGSASIRLSANTSMSFLNLDDQTVQIQLTSGAINIRVRRLDRDDVFEIDTPNQAFSVYQSGSYRVQASDDGAYTVVSVRQGEGESTGNGQTFRLNAGQQGTFSGTDELNAEVYDIGPPDDFDNWAYNRDRRWDNSRSARYLAPGVVGYEDLDDNGDWRDDSNYGHVWFPNRVDAGWAPYHEGHWAWISPWGWTWVDDAPWGYAPFHYGRWVTIGGRWGWVAGPVNVTPVYAPALVVFLGGGFGGGGNVAWFPLGPREVYVPTYGVSRGYMNRVNISNTTVNTTVITNVYNTTIINKSTTITNLTYANRAVPGAVTAVPHAAFASAQPVARVAVRMNAQEIASSPVAARVAVVPSQQSVLGAHANTANRVSAPPAAIARRQVVAKVPPPAPPVSFARQQQALAAHPGQPLAKTELQTLRPAASQQAQPMVKVAPPGKPATPNVGRPGNPPNGPGNNPSAARPGLPANPPPGNQPGNRPANQPANNERPGMGNSAPPDRHAPNQPALNPPAQNHPEMNNRPESGRPAAAPEPNNRPPATEPNNRPAPNENKPAPRPNPPVTEREQPQRTPPPPPPAETRPAPKPRPERTPPPAEMRPAPKQQKPEPKKQTPEEKKREEEKEKKPQA